MLYVSFVTPEIATIADSIRAGKANTEPGKKEFGSPSTYQHVSVVLLTALESLLNDITGNSALIMVRPR